MSEAPVVLHCRDARAGWQEAGGKRHRLVIPESQVARIDALPRPDVEDLGEWDVVYLDGSTGEVLDLVTRKRWNVRLGQCGFGCCACDLVAWPVGYRGRIPEPEPFDGWPFWATEAMWDELAAEVGRPVDELGWDDLLATVAGARGAGSQ